MGAHFTVDCLPVRQLLTLGGPTSVQCAIAVLSRVHHSFSTNRPPTRIKQTLFHLFYRSDTFSLSFFIVFVDFPVASCDFVKVCLQWALLSKQSEHRECVRDRDHACSVLEKTLSV